MRWILLIVILMLIFRWVMASIEVTVQGGPVTIKGGYVDLGTTVVVSTQPTPSEKAGQCIGIMCGVTYN